MFREEIQGVRYKCIVNKSKSNSFVHANYSLFALYQMTWPTKDKPIWKEFTRSLLFFWKVRYHSYSSHACPCIDVEWGLWALRPVTGHVFDKNRLLALKGLEGISMRVWFRTFVCHAAGLRSLARNCTNSRRMLLRTLINSYSRSISLISHGDPFHVYKVIDFGDPKLIRRCTFSRSSTYVHETL